ncbi:MAG TPA: TlpA disulfide reductase family protein [Stellaceae bacterium]|nr:TlpA disulfide reductase family protein [Stellaceae bacterium]
MLAAALAGVGAYHVARAPVGGAAPRRPAASDIFRLSFWTELRAVPNLRFTDGKGRALSLADFRGRPVVLNIWATWCLPCRKEMPTLDRLQQAFDKSTLLVLPLSIDRRGAAAVRRFYRQLGLEALGVYVDPSGEAGNQIDAPGIPITLLLDRDGHEVGRKIGPADWDSPQMIGILRRHLGLSGAGQRSGS